MSGITTAPAAPPAPFDPADGLTLQAAFLALHNAARSAARAGPALALSDRLNRAAFIHAHQMAVSGAMTHSGLADGDLGGRLHTVAYPFFAAGENVASRGYETARAAFAGWMGSPGHRANVLGDYTEAGFALAYGAGRVPYWCAVFGKPMSSTWPFRSIGGATVTPGTLPAPAGDNTGNPRRPRA